MKKKLIAIVITTLLAGGAGTTALYNYYESNSPAEIVQVSEEDTSQDENENILEENVEILDENNNEDNVISNETLDNPVEAANVQQQEKQSVNAVQAQPKQQAEVQKQETPVQKPVNQGTTSTGNNVQQNSTSSDAFMSQVEQLIYSKVNEKRAENGVGKLSYSTTMQKYARIKSQDMGDKNYFDHKDLNGNLITVRMKNDGVTYSAWGENIAYISGVSDPNALAQQFMTNWMNSEGHRENILSTNFSSIGIGVYKIGNKVYATQEFYR